MVFIFEYRTKIRRTPIAGTLSNLKNSQICFQKQIDRKIHSVAGDIRDQSLSGNFPEQRTQIAGG